MKFIFAILRLWWAMADRWITVQRIRYNRWKIARFRRRIEAKEREMKRRGYE